MTNKLSRSRRGFLRTSTGVVATAALAAGASSALAQRNAAGDPIPTTPGRRKRVTPGSASPAYSRAAGIDRIIYVAGCVGTYQKGTESAMDHDFETQAGQTLLNLKASVEAAGSSMDRVLKCTCFLKKFEHFAKFNEVYMKFFPEPRPARSTVVVADFVVPGALLEVDCVCFVD